MSNTAVLERAPLQMRTSLKDRLISPAEEEHKNRIADNFRRLRFDSAEAYNSARDGDPVADVAVMDVAAAEPEAPVAPAPAAPVAPAEEQVSSAASRIAQYAPVAAPAGKQDLFAGLVFKNGKLERPQAETAPEAAVVAAAPASAIDEEDATPTRRTMDTLNRPAAMQSQETAVAAAVAVSPALSTKMKVALIAVIATIVLAIVLICINSSIIRSLNSDIAMREAELSSLTQATETVREQIADLTSPESIAEWAAKHDMVLK